MSTRRHIVFVTGTRADFGKLKPLMRAVTGHPRFEVSIFVTGMHTLKQYGYTVREVHRAGFQHVHVFMNQHLGDPMEMVLANTISGLSRFVHEHGADLLVVHGDRVECLAGAIVGALSNTLVAHVEGGERSGTVDELIRHATSKLAHLHFVAHEEARTRLVQMGEPTSSVFVIGSPDIDLMLSDDLPALTESRRHYDIAFEDYGILLYHPVTTERAHMAHHARVVVDAALQSGRHYVVVYPNNDTGTQEILREYQRFADNPRFRVFPSLSFEHFLTLLKHARFLLGNSSAGVREAPVYGVPSVDIGNRQAHRHSAPSILHVEHELPQLLSAIARAASTPRCAGEHVFGRGDSAERFVEELEHDSFWSTPAQKHFRDLPGFGSLRASNAQGSGSSEIVL